MRLLAPKPILALTALLLGSGYGTYQYLTPEQYSPRTSPSPHSGKDALGADGAARMFHEMRKNMLTGKLELADVERAVQGWDLAPARASVAGISWKNLGPDNRGGRTRAFLFDKDNPSKLFAGSVSGGIWISQDRGATWNQTNDFSEILTISTMAQAINGDLYAGTGEGLFYETYSFGAGGFPGMGIWKSTDGGASFQRLPSTWENAGADQSAYLNVGRIAVDPEDSLLVYAATSKGIRVSRDGGTTWTNPLPGQSFESRDIKVSADGNVVIADVQNKVYRSTDKGLTFTKVSGSGAGQITESDVRRIEFALAPSSVATMYAALANSGGRFKSLYQSLDSGQTWTLHTNGTIQFNPFGSQGWYDIALGVHPLDSSVVYLGGQVELQRYTNAKWDVIGVWLSNDETSPRYIHADMHGIVFDPKDPETMVVHTDGGMHITNNSRVSAPDFRVLNNNYTTLQLYSIWPGINGEVIGGAQDNGTHYLDFSLPSIKSTKHVNGGDGTYGAISLYDPKILFAASQNGFLRRSNDRGATMNDFKDSHVFGFSQFVTPFRLWENITDSVKIPDPSKPGDSLSVVDSFSFFAFLTSGGVFMTPEALDFSKTPEWFRISNATYGRNLEFSEDGNHLFVSASSSSLFRVSGIKDAWRNNAYEYDQNNQFNSTAAGITTQGVANFSGRYITGIGVDPNDANRVLVGLGNYGSTEYVYLSTNALSNSPTWTPITNNLPKSPCYDVLIDQNDPNTFYAGTELGLFVSTDAGLTWTREAEFPTVAAMMLVQQRKIPGALNVGDIYVGTHGRGFWTSKQNTGIGKGGLQSGADARAVKAWPNPVSSTCKLSFYQPQAESVTIQVLDLKGRTVGPLVRVKASSGWNSSELNLEELPMGTYIIQVQGSGGAASTRILKR